MSDKLKVTSLDVDLKNLLKNSDEDITLDELKMTTSDAFGDLDEEQLSDLKNRYKKIHYTIMDMEQNRKGFGVTEEAMKTYVDHFHQTKNDSDLHGFFKDHDFKHIDSLMGRVVDTKYDAKNKRVRRTALIDMRHPSAKRLDMFKNLSTTMLHGKPVCSECGGKYRHCDCTNNFPRSSVAFGIEDSLVTISGYKNAKRDSLSLFRDSLMTSAPELMQELEESLDEVDEDEKNKKGNEENKENEDGSEKTEETKETEDEVEETSDKETEKISKEIESIKESINILKKIIERQS